MSDMLVFHRVQEAQTGACLAKGNDTSASPATGCVLSAKVNGMANKSCSIMLLTYPKMGRSPSAQAVAACACRTWAKFERNCIGNGKQGS